MAKVIEYSNGQLIQRPAPRPLIKRWLEKDHMKNENLGRTANHHDDLIRELMTRQDRQGKWILFLLVSWVFAGMFLALTMLVR